MSQAETSAAHRVAQLDSLRGIAALLVVFHHTPQAFINDVNDPSSGLSAYLDFGRLGVVIFFMISGFVIVQAIPGKGIRSISLFWKHRVFRLFPAFWISVFFAALVARIVAGSDCCAFVMPVTKDIFLANMTMIPLRLHQPMLIGVYWSLELELLFYGLITAVTIAGRNSIRSITAAAFLTFFAAIVAAMVTTAGSGAREIGKDQLFLSLLHLSLMFAGGAVRYHWDAQGAQKAFLSGMPMSLKGYFGLQFGFFAAVAVVKLRHGIEPHTFRVASTYLLGIGAFLFCLRYCTGSWIGTFMGNRSYAIYLLHVPVLSLLSYGIARLLLPPLGYSVYLTVTLIITLTLADLMRRFIERPAIRLGHLHDRWLANRKRMPAIVAAGAIGLNDQIMRTAFDTDPARDAQVKHARTMLGDVAAPPILATASIVRA